MEKPGSCNLFQRTGNVRFLGKLARLYTNLDLISYSKIDAKGNNLKFVNYYENLSHSRITGKLLNFCARRKVNFFWIWLKEQAKIEQPKQFQVLETASDYELKSSEVGNTDIPKFSFHSLHNRIGSWSDFSD